MRLQAKGASARVIFQFLAWSYAAIGVATWVLAMVFASRQLTFSGIQEDVALAISTLLLSAALVGFGAYGLARQSADSASRGYCDVVDLGRPHPRGRL